MAKVSISKAAQLAGISRSALYKTYIEQGKISLSKDAKGRKSIDTSEILRVFGELKVDSKSVSVDNTKTVNQTQEVSTNTEKDFEIKLLKSQLEEAKRRGQEAQEREAWYKAKIDTLTDSLKLLEGPKYPRLWWQFWK